MKEVYVTDELHHCLKVEAAKLGVPITHLASQAVADWLAEHSEDKAFRKIGEDYSQSDDQ